MKRIIEKRSNKVYASSGQHTWPQLSAYLSFVLSASPVTLQLAPVWFSNNQEWEKPCLTKKQEKKFTPLYLCPAPILHLWCPWFTCLVFWWSCRVFATSFCSSWVFRLRILHFFLYYLFCLRPVFHLFQAARVVFNCIFWLRNFLFPEFQFDSLFQDFPYLLNSSFISCISSLSLF
jgi:hypothetical protein